MSFLVKNWMLILVMVLSGAMLVWPLIQRRLSPVKEVGNLKLTHMMNHQNAVVLDVREPAEYAGGRLPNAIQIPLSELGKRAGELDKMKARPIVVYCARGQRSQGAGSVLAKLGFADIYQLQGGFKAWKDAGLPLQAA